MLGSEALILQGLKGPPQLVFRPYRVTSLGLAEFSADLTA